MPTVQEVPSANTTEEVLCVGHRADNTYIAADIFTGTYGDNGNYASVGGKLTSLQVQQTPWANADACKKVLVALEHHDIKTAVQTIQGIAGYVDSNTTNVTVIGRNASAGWHSLTSRFISCSTAAAAGLGASFIGPTVKKVTGLYTLSIGVANAVGCITSGPLNADEKFALHTLAQSVQSDLNAFVKAYAANPPLYNYAQGHVSGGHGYDWSGPVAYTAPLHDLTVAQKQAFNHAVGPFLHVA